ncbi:MAG: peptidase [Cyanobacteria bacterium J06641_5]
MGSNWRRQQRLWRAGGIATIAVLWSICAGAIAAPGVGQLKLGPPSLPTLQVRPLPESLSNAAVTADRGDYLDRIEPTLLGYLLWSQFPIRVYVEPSPTPGERQTLTSQQVRVWQQAVDGALQEWGAYLPLERVLEPEAADITVRYQSPKLRITRDPETGRLRSRARAGETRYEFYVRREPTGSPTLAHRMFVDLAPTSSLRALQATARHELGHAMGLWGHSEDPTDALYLKQVGEPPPISSRDANTLIRLYQQPSRLGGALPLIAEDR